jgi:uncharacterized protein
MAGASLLALIDDIATILDDVALLTKVASQKTAGVLGDDLALNAQQVAGVQADRELPVVWAVAKGSFWNKVILVPSALAISALIPWAVLPLLMLGGAFLCFEGFEKLAHRWLHGPEENRAHHLEQLEAVSNPTVDLVAFEKEKIQGAVRTDFILSAEIITITLGTVASKVWVTQLAVLASVALIMTVGVYGLVGAIVKIDDVGLYFTRIQGSGLIKSTMRLVGEVLLRLAPALMKSLGVLGTVAMFLVGGGILVHGLPFLHHAIEVILQVFGLPTGIDSGWVSMLTASTLEGLVGVLCGALVLVLLHGWQTLWSLVRPPSKSTENSSQ